MVNAIGVEISHRIHKSVEARCGVMVKGTVLGTISGPQRDVFVKLL